MKICIISEPQGGGVEKVNMTLAQGLMNRGNDVSIISVTGAITEMGSSFNVPIIYLQKASKKRSCFALLRAVKQLEPQVMIVSSFWDIMFLLIIRSAVAFTFKIVYVQHSVYSRAALNRLADRVITSYVPHFFGELNRIDGIVFVSQGVFNDFKAYFPNYSAKKIVIYNPITKTKEINSLKKRELSGDCVRLVSAGRLEVEKNQGMLIDVVAILRDRGVNVTLTIFGEGSEKKVLEDKINMLNLDKYVTLAGFSRHLADDMRKFDVFLLSSMHESFGNVIVEALNKGLPVVSTDCPFGPAEILDNGQYGLLVPMNDANAMVAAVEKTIQSFDSDVSKRNYKRSLQFSVQESVDRYYRFIEELGSNNL